MSDLTRTNKSSLLTCLNTVWQGFFCPSVLFGRVYETLSEEETSWKRACVCHSIVVEGGLTAASLLLCIPGRDPHTTFLFWEGLFFVWWMCGIYTGDVRQTLQRKYHLQVQTAKFRDISGG